MLRVNMWWAFSLSLPLDVRNDEPPPEPAPPEVPPRGHSLLQSMSSMRKRSDYQIHIQENNCDQKHEEFIPQEKQQGELRLKIFKFLPTTGTFYLRMVTKGNLSPHKLRNM